MKTIIKVFLSIYYFPFIFIWIARKRMIKYVFFISISENEDYCIERAFKIKKSISNAYLLTFFVGIIYLLMLGVVLFGNMDSDLEGKQRIFTALSVGLVILLNHWYIKRAKKKYHHNI